MRTLSRVSEGLSECLSECHCSVCGVPVSARSADRVTACCDAPRCNSAGRVRYAVPGAGTWWLRSAQFTACCDAGAAVKMAGRAIPRRVAAW